MIAYRKVLPRRRFGCLALVPSLFMLGCSNEIELVAPNPLAQPVQAKPATALTPDQLKARIDDTLAYTGQRVLVADSNAAWQVLHGILAYGPELQLSIAGKDMPALDYLLGGGRLTGWVLSPGAKGVETLVEPGSKTGQGHEDQWLGYLSLTGLDPETPLKVGDTTYKVRDLLTQAQWDIYPNMEATWTLMALASYCPLDVKWTNKQGEEWTIERVVAMEANQNIEASACGGTHRLVGLTVALNRHLKEGGQATGGWQAAQGAIRKFIHQAKARQQADGSFSSNYFREPAQNSADIGERIGTTGHTLEFLALAMDDKEIREPWVERSALALCDMLDQTKDQPLECGGLYHAVRGLQLYRQRLFGAPGESQPSAKPTAGPVAEATTK